METQKLANHWWAILIRGVVALLFALMAFFATGLTLDLLLIFLGVYLLLDGLFSIIGGFRAMHHKNWWLLLLEGVISIAAGVVIFVWPAISLMFLVYLIAIWAIITGIFEFLASLMATWAESGKVFLGVTGVLSVILGVVIFIYPLFSLTAIIWLIGIYALIIGLSLIFFGLKLRSLK